MWKRKVTIGETVSLSLYKSEDLLKNFFKGIHPIPATDCSEAMELQEPLDWVA